MFDFNEMIKDAFIYKGDEQIVFKGDVQAFGQIMHVDFRIDLSECTVVTLCNQFKDIKTAILYVYFYQNKTEYIKSILSEQDDIKQHLLASFKNEFKNDVFVEHYADRYNIDQQLQFYCECLNPIKVFHIMRRFKTQYFEKYNESLLRS